VSGCLTIVRHPSSVHQARALRACLSGKAAKQQAGKQRSNATQQSNDTDHEALSM
jgi:hypothetical protein